MNHAAPATASEALQRLSDVDWLALSATEVVLPTLGMNNEYLDQMPPELQRWFGTGLRFWQSPKQFAGLLALLRDRPAASYLEIGSRWGGTFAVVDTVLRRRNPLLRSFAMDIIECPPLLQTYRSETDLFYVQGDSRRLVYWNYFEIGGF